jgi:hypothetical protein
MPNTRSSLGAGHGFWLLRIQASSALRNFGALGEPAAHPELLAGSQRILAGGWRLKPCRNYW